MKGSNARSIILLTSATPCTVRLAVRGMLLISSVQNLHHWHMSLTLGINAF